MAASIIKGLNPRASYLAVPLGIDCECVKLEKLKIKIRASTTS